MDEDRYLEEQSYSITFLRKQVANLEKQLESYKELVSLWRKEAYFQVALQGVGQEPAWSDPDAVFITEDTKKRHEELMAAQVAQWEEYVGITEGVLTLKEKGESDEVLCVSAENDTVWFQE
jgi:hypothetical protein